MPVQLSIGLPVSVIAITLAGALIPAWTASRLPPIAGIQYRAVQAGKGSKLGTTSLVALALRELMRRPTRTLLSAVVSLVSSALLVLLLATTGEQQGLLSGTLLGEFMLINIEGYHFAIVAIGFILAALSITNGLIGSILLRRSEIAVLKAVGWRTRQVASQFLIEGICQGLLGGIPGALLGGLAFFALYPLFSFNLANIVLLGALVPGAVGAISAFLPARIASRILPAVALRYEQ